MLRMEALQHYSIPYKKTLKPKHEAALCPKAASSSGPSSFSNTSQRTSIEFLYSQTLKPAMPPRRTRNLPRGDRSAWHQRQGHAPGSSGRQLQRPETPLNLKILNAATK